MISTFPLEIEEIIFDLLAEDDEGLLAMKMCSLVCQAFLPICRKHIFERIVLNCDNSPSTHAFERLLCERPEIADYIRKLEYAIQLADLTSPSIQESMERISRLEFLSLRAPLVYPTVKPYWNYPFRPALLHLLHLPTLTHFKVDDLNLFALSDLIPCVNLKFLDIGYASEFVAAENTFPSTLPRHSIQLNEFVVRSRLGASTSATTKLCTARRPDGQPIIDFGSLSKISVVFFSINELRDLQELFRHCHFLTNASISCK